MRSAVVPGIGSSCDGTGAGPGRDGRPPGHAVASGMDEHARFHGLASGIGAVAFTTGPGLPDMRRASHTRREQGHNRTSCAHLPT